MGPLETSNNASIAKGLPLFKTDLELVLDLPPAALVSRLQRVASMSCLLLSHLAWDNPKTQSCICEDDRLTQLFHLVDVGHDFQRILMKIKTLGNSSPLVTGVEHRKLEMVLPQALILVDCLVLMRI